MHCANCGIALGKLEDARAWGGRPACNRCFKQLSADRPKTGRRFWKPLAIALDLVAVVQGVAIAALLSHPAREVATSRAMDERMAAASRAAAAPPDDVTAPASVGARPLTETNRLTPADAAASPGEIDAGPSRAQILSTLRVDRPWYWHYEHADKNSPFHFAVDDDGSIRTVGQGGSQATLQRRWVLSLGGHYFVPTDDHTLRGFHTSSGRQVGAFTE